MRPPDVAVGRAGLPGLPVGGEEAGHHVGVPGDEVLIKEDGSPAYNFCCVIDDALMEITCVIRGEDHISNTPKQLIIYKALDLSVPEFAHLPLILKPTGKGKLSKRDGDKLGFPVFPLAWKDPKSEEISSLSRQLKKAGQS